MSLQKNLVIIEKTINQASKNKDRRITQTYTGGECSLILRATLPPLTYKCVNISASRYSCVRVNIQLFCTLRLTN